MLKTNRKLILRLAILCLLIAGFFVAQIKPVNAQPGGCWQICDFPTWHCNIWTGECECSCPDIFGICPPSCY
ncbi:MAG TPA: hypothetical protein VGO50_20205 [Pyrinomonadaceae bacterium]|nr:hypothetical protein [Pyrinomonadaceae bacterium]